jgi:NADH:ubiquinone oxidoreductase subunit 3 (subunit A)
MTQAIFVINAPSVEGVSMQNPWIYVGLFLVIGIVLPVAPLIIALFIAPKKPNPIKQSTYECGLETVGESWVQFKAQYYIFALVFLIFDVETVFLFPWALTINVLPFFAVAEGVLFILILIVGLSFAWRKGMLEWV